MHITRRQLVLSASMSLAPALHAQESWPSKPISIVVPYAPGGVADNIARTLGTRMAEGLGQPVIVENRSGGNGLIGSDYVANAKPDGYTLVLMIETNTIAPSLYPKLAHDPLRAFAPISLLATASQIIVAHPSFPPSNLRELIALGKTSATPLFYASSGNGTAFHLGMEQLKTLTGMKLQHVPYKGGGQAITDLVAGQVPLGIIGIAPALQHVKTGRLKALAVTGQQRVSVLPEVLTVQEQGVAGFESFNWFGLLAPSGTPRGVVDRLYAESVKAMRSPELADRFDRMPVQVATSTSPADFASFMAQDVAKWRTVVRDNNVTPD